MEYSKSKVMSLLLLSCSLNVWDAPEIEAKSALDAIENAKNAANTMRNAAKAIEGKYIAIDSLIKLSDYYVEANGYVVNARQDLADSKKNLAINEENVHEAQRAVVDAEQAKKDWAGKAVEGQTKEDHLKKELDKAKKIVDDLKAREISLRRRYESVAGVSNGNYNGNASQIKKMLEEIRYDENLINNVEAQLGINTNPGVDTSKLWADLGLDTIYDKITKADAHYFAILEQLEAAVDAKEQFKSATEDLDLSQKDLIEAKKYYEEAKNDVQTSQNNLQIAEADIKELKQDIKDQQSFLDPSKVSWKTAQMQMRHYSWKDDNGGSGRQLETPLSFSMVDKTNEYSIDTSYVFSNNKSAENGKENSFSDLTLSYAKRRDFKDATLRYMMSVSLPIGKSQINSNSIMLEDLVPNSRFSYGLDFTPAISYTKMFGEKDSLTYTASYAIRGKYKYDSTLPDATVRPGNQLTNSLSWLHVEDKWQLLTSLDFVSSSKTNENDLLYKEGKNLSWGIYFNKVLSAKQDLMFYFNFVSGGATNYYTPVTFEVFPDGVNQRFYGVQWQNKISQKHTLRLMFNAMNTNGASYNPINFRTSYSRVRYGFSVSYDIALNDNSSVSVEWERYNLKEQSPGSKYRGNNFYLMFNKSF